MSSPAVPDVVALLDKKTCAVVEKILECQNQGVVEVRGDLRHSRSGSDLPRTPGVGWQRASDNAWLYPLLTVWRLSARGRSELVFLLNTHAASKVS